LLESVVNFSGRDVFSNEEFDHNALFHAPRYLLSRSYLNHLVLNLDTIRLIMLNNQYSFT